MRSGRGRADFEREMLPYLGASYNLARWLLRSHQDAEDAVQEAYLRAFRKYDQYSGDGGASWMLRIVRNCCLTQLGRRANSANVVHLDSVTNLAERVMAETALHDREPLPDANLIASSERAALRAALFKLPQEHREIIVLREFESLTYREIAEVVAIPVGTVMSRLSRARKQLRRILLADIHWKQAK